MKPIGFSTGALAKGDFATGLAVQRDDVAAVLHPLRDEGGFAAGRGAQIQHRFARLGV